MKFRVYNVKTDGRHTTHYTSKAKVIYHSEFIICMSVAMLRTYVKIEMTDKIRVWR
jgi:hypothetical protein